MRILVMIRTQVGMAPLFTDDSDLEWHWFFVVLACHWAVLDGFNWHFQASVHKTLCSAVHKLQQHWKIPEKIIRECRESNLVLLGDKQECYLFAVLSPTLSDIVGFLFQSMMQSKSETQEDEKESDDLDSCES